MAEKEPVTISKEEAAAIDPNKIGKGIPVEGDSEVEAQGYTITCGSCGNKFWNRENWQYTICPFCGIIKKWW